MRIWPFGAEVFAAGADAVDGERWIDREGLEPAVRSMTTRVG